MSEEAKDLRRIEVHLQICYHFLLSETLRNIGHPDEGIMLIMIGLFIFGRSLVFKILFPQQLVVLSLFGAREEAIKEEKRSFVGAHLIWPNLI